MNPTQRNPVIQHVEAQHRELHRRLNELRNMFRDELAEEELPTAFPQVTRLIGELRTFCAEHFATEDRGGYLEEAGARVPRLGQQIDAIEREHGELLAETDRLLQAATQAGTTRADWQRLASQFGELRTKIVAHETAEHRILEQGFNEDLTV